MMFGRQTFTVWTGLKPVRIIYNVTCETPVSFSRGFPFTVEFFCFSRIGLDLIEGKVRDNKKAGVLEPCISKIKCLKFATEAAITILRIDDMIKLSPEKKEESAYGQAMQRGEL